MVSTETFEQMKQQHLHEMLMREEERKKELAIKAADEKAKLAATAMFLQQKRLRTETKAAEVRFLYLILTLLYL